MFRAGYPRLLTYHQFSAPESAERGKLPLAEVAETLGLHDVMVGPPVDHTTVATFSNRRLRQINPDLLILPCTEAFAKVEEGNEPIGGTTDIHALYEQGIESAWYMRGPDGSRLEAPAFPGHVQMNHTEYGARVDGVHFRDYIHHTIAHTMLPSGIWNGIQFDQVEWFPNPLLGASGCGGADSGDLPFPAIDLDEDGVAETDAELAEAWFNAFPIYFDALRAQVGHHTLLHGNGGELPQQPSLHRRLNGFQRERLTPYRSKANGDWSTVAMGGWFSQFERLRTADRHLAAPQMVGYEYTGMDLGVLRDPQDPRTICLPEREPLLETRDYQRMRLGLTSTLLYDAGFSATITSAQRRPRCGSTSMRSTRRG